MSLNLPLVLPKPRPLDRLTCITGTALKLTKMIVKTQSPPPLTTKSFHLSHLDQNAVRVYISTMCIFPVSISTFHQLSPPHLLIVHRSFLIRMKSENAIYALEHGLRRTLQTFPFLAGTLSLTDRHSGRLSLEYPVKVSDDEMRLLFHSKQIPYHKDNFPYSYTDLKRNSMPPGAFKSDIFVPDDLAMYPGVPPHAEGKVDFDLSNAPVMRVQANFIPGGLVLSTYIHHSVVDCTGVTAFWQVFSSNISAISGNEDFGNLGMSFLCYNKSSTNQHSTNEPSRISVLATTSHWQTAAISRSDHASADCYCDGTYSYPKTLPKETKCAQRLFVIPAQRICDYRERLRPHFPSDSQPTMCNVLAALVWTHVTRARAARLIKCGYTETSIGIATDLRRRYQPPVSTDYMGNMALFSRGTLSIADLTAEER